MSTINLPQQIGEEYQPMNCIIISIVLCCNRTNISIDVEWHVISIEYWVILIIAELGVMSGFEGKEINAADKTSFEDALKRISEWRDVIRI